MAGTITTGAGPPSACSVASAPHDARHEATARRRAPARPSVRCPPCLHGRSVLVGVRGRRGAREGRRDRDLRRELRGRAVPQGHRVRPSDSRRHGGTRGRRARSVPAPRLAGDGQLPAQRRLRGARRSRGRRREVGARQRDRGRLRDRPRRHRRRGGATVRLSPPARRFDAGVGRLPREARDSARAVRRAGGRARPRGTFGRRGFDPVRFAHRRARRRRAHRRRPQSSGGLPGLARFGPVRRQRSGAVASMRRGDRRHGVEARWRRGAACRSRAREEARGRAAGPAEAEKAAA